MEAHALREQGWSISAIARHLGHDRKTVRAYLNGRRQPERRARSAPTVIEPFVDYCRIRLADDPHLWASTLFDELAGLGFTGSYPSLTSAIRSLRLRPHCDPCQASRGRDVAIIDHPAGVETQFDWLELPDPPAGWNAGKQAHLLVGALSHSGRWRGVLAPSEDFGHTVAALDQVARRLDGLTQRWRFDRMATVCYPASGRVTPAFASVAKYYAVAVDICPPRRGNRKGVVEKANHAAAQRWWRTVGDDVSIADAQADLDRLSSRLDGRRRVRAGIRLSVGELAGTERLRPVPATPFPAEISEARTVTPQGLVSFAGNQYSVPPGLAGARVEVRHRLGGDSLQIATSRGTTIAAHHRRPDGAGAIVRESGHVIALEKAVLAAFSDAPPCKHKTRRPRSAAAAAEAARLTGHPGSAADRVVIDLAAYAALVPAAAARAAAPTPIRKETQ